MRPDGTRRFCEHCDEYVHDLSAMSEPEARRLLRSFAGRKACLRYRSDANGRIRFAASPPLGTAVLVASTLLFAACAGWDAEEPLSLPDVELCRDEAGYVMACDDGLDTIPDEDARTRPPAPAHGSASEADAPDDERSCMGAVAFPVDATPHSPLHAPVLDIEWVEPIRPRSERGVEEAPSPGGEVSMHVEAFSRSGMRPVRKADRRRGRRKRGP